MGYQVFACRVYGFQDSLGRTFPEEVYEELDLGQYFDGASGTCGLDVFHGIQVRKGDDRQAIKKKVRDILDLLYKKYKMGKVVLGYYEGLGGDVWDEEGQEYEEREPENEKTDDVAESHIVQNDKEDEQYEEEENDIEEL
jgi:hypothetical protein